MTLHNLLYIYIARYFIIKKIFYIDFYELHYSNINILLNKISLPRAQFNYGNCFSMNPATKTKNKVIFTMNEFTNALRK